MAKQYGTGTTTVPPIDAEVQPAALAERLGLPYVDLTLFRVDADLFRSIPVEWMLRYHFVPERLGMQFDPIRGR